MINMDDENSKEMYLVAVNEHPYVFHNLSEAIDFLDYVIMSYDDCATIFFKKSNGINEEDFDYDEMHNTQLYKSWESFEDIPF